ncbi:hypothetical protein P280DRAFT_511664 [Massarina eburnea CBS 473.64]|uniref:Uncharacterized protein n=1 Tax=Massarina eburnea CBS 473.64 TaxID=1395130 RepID=A0A6A6RHM0_9PLEO|nr:hypothetical protein P280DRAFT_511664 [Massarina eburnea CBS 473.64]
MRFTSTFVAFAMASFATAAVHFGGLCVDNVAGKNVYNDAATKDSCINYQVRNTGSKPWDTCPDCTVKEVGGLTYCNSEAKHIGGDELNYYCKQNGADGSLAD